jgi:hypothetical protein
MKKFFLFSLFCVSQGFLFLWMRKMPSFGQAKILFALIEACFCGLAGLMYLFFCTRRREIRAPSIPITLTPQISGSLSSELQDKFENEKKELLVQLEDMSRGIVELQSKLKLENEKNEECLRKMEEAEKTASQSCSNKKLYIQALLELSIEIQKLCSQLEQDRKTHAIEIRALLGKDEKKLGVSLPPIPGATSGIIPSSIAPIAAVLLVLLQCQKGFDKSENSAWPDAEHRDLIRRAFFDRLHQAAHLPVVVFSLDRPTELYRSPSFPQALSSKDCIQIVETFGRQLRQLSSFEPFPVSLEHFSGMYIAFKVAWQNLDDLVVMVPSS